MLALGGLKNITPPSGAPLSFQSLTLTSTTVNGITFTDPNSIQRITWGGGAYLAYSVAGGYFNMTASLAVGSELGAQVIRGGTPGTSANALNLHSSAGIFLDAALSDQIIFYAKDAKRELGGGGSSALGEIPVTANINSTGVGNVGASGPDDLQTYQLPANVLTVAGRGIRIKAWGTTANNANAKTVRLVFGSETLITKQLTASIAGFWKLEATILRTGTSTQDFFAEAVNYGGTTVSSTDGATVAMLASVGTATQTETAAIDIKTQSTVSTANNDIVSEGLIVEYI